MNDRNKARAPHSRGSADELATGLTAKLRQSELTSTRSCGKRRLELYRNLGEWLLKKTEKDSEQRFVSIAVCRLLKESGCHSSYGLSS